MSNYTRNPEIDFTNIRMHSGGQREAFEELICQLVRSFDHYGGDYIRKNGTGGDAGVECYRKYPDGSEVCWQAKFFMRQIKAPQWRQIKKSLKTAINKHPDMKEYIICIPQNLNDSQRSHFEKNNRRKQCIKNNTLG